MTVLDAGEPDALARRFLGDFAGRLRWIDCDVRDRRWFEEAHGHDIDRIVHGAAVTPHAFVDDDGNRHDPEAEDPERVLDINLGGTLAVLAFARALPGLKRLLLVSTGSVYGDEGSHDAPLPEDGYVAPISLYGISKYAAEMVAGRFGQLYRLPIVAARLSSVFGPMDRILPSRHVTCAPNRMTGLALAGEPIRLNSAESVGDWISVTDVATALALLVGSARSDHAVYNVASGLAVTLGDLAEKVTQAIPGATWTVDPRDPNVSADPLKRWGQWGAYDIGRLGSEFGWQPAPLESRLNEYIGWRRSFEKGHLK